MSQNPSQVPVHNPVLIDEVLLLAQKSLKESNKSEDELRYIVDATFGAGGYSQAILESLPGNIRLIATDRDNSVEKYAIKLSQTYGDRFIFKNTLFSELPKVLQDLKINKVHFLVADFGISSMHVDNAERGFSFQKEGKLDMRMSSSGVSARDFVNSATEKELSDVIFKYGEERLSRKIAHNIVHERRMREIDTTLQLANIVKSSYGKLARMQSTHPATKTFQAVRIHINNELSEIEAFLTNSHGILAQNSTLACVSFHSLEDGIVKQFLKEKCGKATKHNKYASHANQDTRNLSEINPEFQEELARKETDIVQQDPATESGIFSVITKKPITPNRSELKRNPRSRSAKLRAASAI